MRYIVLTGLAVVAGLVIRKKDKYRDRVLIALGLVVVLMSFLYNLRSLPAMLKFVRPLNQAFYQTDYLEEGSYPDSLLMMIFEGRKVYVRDDAYVMGEPEKHGKNFNYALYHARNEYYFLEYLNTDLIKDAAMNEEVVTDELISRDFDSIGPVNDMLRYCFIYGDLLYESANYFAYYWYYYEYLGEVRAYICSCPDSKGETVFTSDELVMFWNVYEGKEEEDLYIMTKDYYDSVVRTDGEVAAYE